MPNLDGSGDSIVVNSNRRPWCWAAVLALSLLAACAKQTPPQQVSAANAAAAAGADRQGRFAGSADALSMCVASGSHERHPELSFDMNVSPPRTVSAKQYQSDEQAIWVAEFHEAGAAETDVFLRNVSATPPDLDEVWRIVAICAGS